MTAFTVRQTSSTLRGGDVLRAQSIAVMTSGRCSTGVTVTSVSTTKSAGVAGRGPLVAGTTTGRAGRLVAQRGTTTVGVSVVATPSRRAAPVGIVTMRSTQSSTHVARRDALGVGRVGAGVTGVTRKIASARSQVVIGLTGTYIGEVPRLQGGVNRVGVTTVSSHRRTAQPQGVASLGVTPVGVTRRTAFIGGTLGSGGTASGLGRRVGVNTGLATITVMILGTAQRRLLTVGVSVIGVFTSGESTRVAVSRGVDVVALTSRHVTSVIPTGQRLRSVGREPRRYLTGRRPPRRVSGMEPIQRAVDRV